MGYVYCIQNTINSKRYIGSTALSAKKRWADHRSQLRRGTHTNKHLQSSWNKHGERAFEFSVIEDNVDDNVLVTREDE